MNRIEHLINNPYEVDNNDIDLLNAEIEKYPYFYSLRALKLLALKKANDKDFENQLKITAVLNNNKGLFEFLYSSENNLEVDNEDISIEEGEINIENSTSLETEILIEENIIVENFVEENSKTLEIENEENILKDEIIKSEENIAIPEIIEEEIITNFTEVEVTIEEEIVFTDKKDIEINSTEDNIINAIENSIQVTTELIQNEEIISQAIEETKDVILTTEILEDLEQVDLVNRSKKNTNSFTAITSTPITKTSPFLILNPSDKIVRNLDAKKVEHQESEEIEKLPIAETLNEKLVEFEEPIETTEISIPIIDEKQEINTVTEDNSFSFNEWLKLPSSNLNDTNKEKEQKFQIIEDFLEKNPKITPLKKQEIPESKNEIKNLKQSDFSDLMTETLAQIYIEQKQYEKAIKAYKILILKYPEKNSLFANRIKEIEILKNSK